MSYTASRSNGRLVGAVGAVLLPGALLYALLNGLIVPLPSLIADDPMLFTTVPPPPPPRPRERIRPHRTPSKRREGAASPPNLRAKPTEVVAPPPVVPPVIPPPPVVVARVAGLGAADHAGASDVPGPGSGSGGIGNGTGSGGRGDGDGDGGDYTPPEQRKGRLKMSDLPASAEQAGIGGTVGVRYLVDTDGRVIDCAVTRSSGNADLDATTCRLIKQRFRFDPSRDDRGRPVRAWVVESHSWDIEHVAADADD